MSYLITMAALTGKTETELSGLYQVFMNALMQSEPGSAERRNALASLENIQRARTMINLTSAP